MKLVLSIFPGIDLLGRAFESEMPDICLVRGPDLIFGGDIRTWHVPAGHFWGVIGWPPCQPFSPLRHMVEHTHGLTAVAENLIPEFERVVAEAQPVWFLMENSPFAPLPNVAGYQVRDTVLDNRWLGEVQQRRRRFSFGTPQGLSLDVSPDVCLFENSERERCVIASGAKEGSVIRLDRGGRERSGRKRQTLPGNLPRRSVARCLELQGFPPGLLDKAPFTQVGKYQLVGNGVSASLGRAIARAVRRAMEAE